MAEGEYGKRFSRRQSLTFDSPANLADQYGKLRVKGQPEERQGALGDWKQEVNLATAAAQRYLRNQGIDLAREGSLTDQVRGKGYEIDSMADLCARILEWEKMLRVAKVQMEITGDEALTQKAKPSDLLIHASLELAKLTMLAGVYGQEANANRENAATDRKQEWAVELARDLAKDYSNFPAAWRSLPEEEEVGIYAGFEVCCDGETLSALDDTTGAEARSISRETFRTHYFSPARNGKF